ncbi:MAG TPA: Spy/CpxP family protein refolding chaperone, partial [Terriglobales bacterium]|jgi:protein CpxP
MKSTRIKVLAVALAVLLIAAAAVSQTVKRSHWRHGGGMFGNHAMAFFIHKLDLTEAQQAQAKEIMAKEKATLQPLFQELREGRKQLRQLEESASFDEAQVRALATQHSQTITELIVQKARTKSELIKILTPEQKAKLIEMENRREQRFQKRMEQTPPQGQTQ